MGLERRPATQPAGGHVSAPSIQSDDAYLPLKQLADYSGLSVRTLRGYLTHLAHPLPYYRIGGKVLVRRTEFDAWASQFRAVAPSAVNTMVADVLRGL